MAKQPSSPPQDPIPLPNHTPSLEIRHHPEKGRGVFSLESLPRNALVDVSPILLFPHDEYSQHGRFTLLDHYTYRWPGGLALPLGLGSIFNHSRRPNIGFVRDTQRAVIQYKTMRQVEAGEELCISYGKNLWFDYVDDHPGAEDSQVEEHDVESADDMLARITLGDDEHTTQLSTAYEQGLSTS